MAGLARQKESETTPAIIEASSKGEATVVKELTEKGADVNIKDKSGMTPLHYASQGGHVEVVKVLTDLGANTDAKTKGSGYTPLHLAVASGHRDCVRLLLLRGADMSCTDEYGKTPKQTAQLSSKHTIVKLLQSAEIVMAVKNNDYNLISLLKSVTVDNLEPGCLDLALRFAVKYDNDHNISKLVIKGAKELRECLQCAKEEKKPRARAMLLLIIAAQTGDIAIVQKLFGEPAPNLKDEEDFKDDGFPDVQKVVLSGAISTVVPIEIARRNGQSQVRDELLLKTDVNQEEGYVYWHGLQLLQLEESWLRKITWVKKLRLARNGFKTLPPEMCTYLKQLVKFDLQHNLLTTIPKCLLELPSLTQLNLSNNKLTEIPDVAEWSPCLILLDLSNNQLSNLPLNIVAPAIRFLNLSKNLFSAVPSCIYSLTTLHSLDLSDNPGIPMLPLEMGELCYLTHLNLKGNDQSGPPQLIQWDCSECSRYLEGKVQHKTVAITEQEK